MTKLKTYSMRITHLLLSLIALIPTLIEAQDINADRIQQYRYQSLLSSPAVKQGKVLVKNPSTNQIPFNVQGNSALDAFLLGYGEYTTEVRKLIGGTPVIEIYKEDFSGSELRKVSSLDVSQRFVPNIILKNWNREDLFLWPVDCGIMNIQTGESCSFMVMDTDQISPGFWDMPEGDYESYAIFSMYSMEGYAGIAAMVSQVYIDSENPTVIMDANEIKYTISLKSYMPDGSPFFGYNDEDPENEDYAEEGTSISIPGLTGVSNTSSNPNSVVMCNDIQKEINILKTVVYVSPENEVYATSNRFRGVVDKDFTIDLPCELYTTYSSSFCLTKEDELEPLNSFNFYVLSKHPGGSSKVGRGVETDKKPQEVSVHCCFPKNNLETDEYTGLLFGIALEFDESRYTQIVKNGGALLNTDKGFESCLDYSSFPYQQLTEFTTIKEPEMYYTKALCLQGGIGFWLSWLDNSIENVYAFLDPKGPENEYISGLNAIKYFKNLTVNGQEIYPSDLIGQKLNNGDFLISNFEYDNILVDKTISSKTNLTVGFGYSDDYMVDTNAPSLAYYQIRNDNDDVVNAIDPSAGGKLYVIIEDMSEFDLEVSLIPTDAENEQIMLETSNSGSIEVGTLFSIDLTGVNLKNDKWYNLHIYAQDEAGNYMDQTIGYALRGIKTSGIQTMETIQGNATYYDLSGRRIVNPTSGIYIQETSAKDGSTVRNKVFVK